MQDHAPGHVVRAFVRHEVAQQLGPAPRDDTSPGFRVLGERFTLERIDFVANDAGDFSHQTVRSGAIRKRLGFHAQQGNPTRSRMFLRPQNLLRGHSAMLPSMSTPYAIADVAMLVGEPTRAAILLALLGGRPLPAGALALEANLSAAATSLHLSKLTRGGLLSVQQQGRCRYYRLANEEVAHALEALGAIATKHHPGRALSPARAAFRAARTCYDHLAGEFSVALGRRLERDGMVRSASSHLYEVTDRGEHWLADEMGINVAALTRERRVLARRCVDGTERRPHVGGALGAAMLERMLSLRWLVKISGSRALRITVHGQDALGRLVA